MYYRPHTCSQPSLHHNQQHGTVTLLHVLPFSQVAESPWEALPIGHQFLWYGHCKAACNKEMFQNNKTIALNLHPCGCLHHLKKTKAASMCNTPNPLWWYFPFKFPISKPWTNYITLGCTYVSRKRSARALRLICSFLAATSVKMICSGLTPCAAATAKIK